MLAVMKELLPLCKAFLLLLSPLSSLLTFCFAVMKDFCSFDKSSVCLYGKIPRKVFDEKHGLIKLFKEEYSNC